MISLDALDLNMLPISQKLNEGRVVILGSKSSLGLRNKEYYELEIKTNDTREERNDQVIENVICHICDINVPKVYFNEHKNSFRHKFNAKIAHIALRRIQLFMNKDDVNESYEKIPSKHYCPECSLVIDSGDKISHKQSTVHRNSIFLKSFLNNFLKFYTNDEQEINNSKEDSKNIEVANETKHCEDSKKGVNSDKPNISETIIVSDLKQDRKNKEVANETKHREDSKKGEENKKLDSSPILYKAGQVKDKVVDGGRFKATESNFNAVTKISSLIEYCIICDQIFAIEKRSLHLNSDMHCENLLQKLPNENCIRKVNNTQDNCILCNNNFDNYEVHINSEEHITNFKNMIIPDKCKKTAEICYNFNADKINVNTKSQNSEILKSNESKSSTDTNGHTAPLNNNKKKTEEIDECTDNIETGTAVNIELDHGDAIKTDKTDNATDSKVIDAANAIKTAVPGNATDSKVLDAANAIKTAVPGNTTDSKVLDAANAIKTAVPGNATDSKVLDAANAIKTAVPGNTTDSKVLDAANAIKTDVPGNATDSKVLDAANAIKTAVPGNATDSKVLDAANAIKTAVPGNATVSKVVDAANGKALKSVDNCGQLYKTASVNKIIETAKQSENTVKRGSQPYFCNVCQVQVPNNVNNISSHNKGIPHKLKLRQQVDSKIEETSNLHYQMVKTDMKNFVTCIVCDVDLHFNDKNISTHIKGWPHKNNYSDTNLTITKV
ncbi:unnamed protein product [Euphydryas editha]|uniref:U1-type domain-containing protein n=1 Tax=Euphydryas editha TaxID=104508 RepID=A0AAU9T9H1_EUPED|nr:unnamed protein product [Euphydryas editha]